MELTDLRSLMTVLSFVAFLAVFVWAWTARRRPAFDDAAQLPFAGDSDLDADATLAQRTPRRASGAPHE